MVPSIQCESNCFDSHTCNRIRFCPIKCLGDQELQPPAFKQQITTQSDAQGWALNTVPFPPRIKTCILQALRTPFRPLLQQKENHITLAPTNALAWVVLQHSMNGWDTCAALGGGHLWQDRGNSMQEAQSSSTKGKPGIGTTCPPDPRVAAMLPVEKREPGSVGITCKYVQTAKGSQVLDTPVVDL